MKKALLTAALAGIIASAAFADSNVVSSANVVGYVQIEAAAPGAFKLLSVSQFSDGTTNNAISIQDVIKNLADMNPDVAGSGLDGVIDGDKLYVYNGLTYDEYALFQPTSGSPYWTTLGDTAWYVPGMDATASADTVARGISCWIATAATGISTNLVCSGDVYLDDTFDVSIKEGYTLVSYPFSSDITLDLLTLTNGIADVAGSGLDGVIDADKLYVYNGSTYDEYVLFQPTAGASYWTTPGDTAWYVPGMDATMATDTIELGNGFWMETATPSGKTITFEKIYTIN